MKCIIPSLEKLIHFLPHTACVQVFTILVLNREIYSLTRLRENCRFYYSKLVQCLYMNMSQAGNITNCVVLYVKLYTSDTVCVYVTRQWSNNEFPLESAWVPALKTWYEWLTSVTSRCNIVCLLLLSSVAWSVERLTESLHAWVHAVEFQFVFLGKVRGSFRILGANFVYLQKYTRDHMMWTLSQWCARLITHIYSIWACGKG